MGRKPLMATAPVRRAPAWPRTRPPQPFAPSRRPTVGGDDDSRARAPDPRPIAVLSGAGTRPEPDFLERTAHPGVSNGGAWSIPCLGQRLSPDGPCRPASWTRPA